MSTTVSEEQFSDGTISGRGPVDAHGVKSGRWEFYYRSGTLKGVGEFVDGAMNGDWVWTREDGTLMRTGTFVAGEQRGQWKTYDSAGDLARTTDFH
ncbi:toxin-antitoxin system YwqK family antitoxin [Conyzicola sp.]|uniref:toxin-antitoxin system YwqK family antitoxin n=1 Tax=Conyzicola sp. TaxID=1969404 RepID=UPI00398A3183